MVGCCIDLALWKRSHWESNFGSERPGERLDHPGLSPFLEVAVNAQCWRGSSGLSLYKEGRQQREQEGPNSSI